MLLLSRQKIAARQEPFFPSCFLLGSKSQPKSGRTNEQSGRLLSEGTRAVYETLEESLFRTVEFSFRTALERKVRRKKCSKAKTQIWGKMGWPNSRSDSSSKCSRKWTLKRRGFCTPSGSAHSNRWSEHWSGNGSSPHAEKSRSEVSSTPGIRLSQARSSRPSEGKYSSKAPTRVSLAQMGEFHNTPWSY